ncbi:uncharacterized protein EV422DRAFT_491423, partial [Fimicolochytrium jonesii]|uniref:uncharacterized protein n=1 Tax=Fimicolochytrium jonesii TaxID=1396493 RepID=UPI0022FF390A
MGRSKPSLAVVLLFSLSAFAAAIPLHHNPQQPLGASSPLAAVSPICTCADASIPHCASLSLGHGDNFCICLSGAFAICGGKVERERERGGLAVEEAFKVEAKNSKHDDTIEPFTPRFWYTLTATIVLVLIGGIFAGLTIGIMSLDTTNLEILRNSGTEQEQRYAAKIEPVRKHGHWVLTTLLLGNVVINETLPILFDSLVGGGIAAIIISTGLVVLFGEIIPNAICARNGLAVGAAFAPLVKMCMWIMAPLSWPIAKLLDALLGHEEGTIYARAQLKTLIRIHEVNQEGSNGSCGDLIHDEVGIISAVLDLKDKSAKQIMTPLDDVFMMEINQVIDVQMIKELISRGHSRIPVYQGDRSNLIAILLAKRLIGYNVEKAKRISDVPLTYLPIIDGETNLFDMLNFFQEGRSHMAAVAMRVDGSTEREDDGKAEREILGVITLEDVIEELIGEEIIDETDEYIDVHSKIPVKR